MFIVRKLPYAIHHHFLLLSASSQLWTFSKPECQSFHMSSEPKSIQKHPRAVIACYKASRVIEAFVNTERTKGASSPG